MITPASETSCHNQWQAFTDHYKGRQFALFKFESCRDPLSEEQTENSWSPL